MRLVTCVTVGPGRKHGILRHMSRRKDQRHFIALAVSALGKNAEGNSFREPVCTLNLSAHGARISSVHNNLKVGQEVILEYKKSKARYRVVWVGEAGTSRTGQAGLQAIDGENRIPELSEVFQGNYVDTWDPSSENQIPTKLRAGNRIHS